MWLSSRGKAIVAWRGLALLIILTSWHSAVLGQPSDRLAQLIELVTQDREAAVPNVVELGDEAPGFAYRAPQ